MARCLNCIHYDVCDTDRCEKERLYGQCSDFLHDDDVVPKSEVEKAKQEVAREIFEKIEQRFKLNALLGGVVDFGLHFCELKKKYTESEE